MRRKFARVLRKWADLIDPGVSPSSALTVRVEADTADFEAAARRVLAHCEQLRAAAEAVGVSISAMPPRG
jgi:hypothetical protein